MYLAMSDLIFHSFIPKQYGSQSDSSTICYFAYLLQTGLSSEVAELVAMGMGFTPNLQDSKTHHATPIPRSHDVLKYANI